MEMNDIDNRHQIDDTWFSPWVSVGTTMTTGKAPGFAEQSSPAALAIDDLNASVSNLHFDGNLTRRWSRRGSKKRLLVKGCQGDMAPM